METYNVDYLDPDKWLSAQTAFLEVIRSHAADIYWLYQVLDQTLVTLKNDHNIIIDISEITDEE